jgi:hypothetical protein
MLTAKAERQADVRERLLRLAFEVPILPRLRAVMLPMVIALATGLAHRDCEEPRSKLRGFFLRKKPGVESSTVHICRPFIPTASCGASWLFPVMDSHQNIERSHALRRSTRGCRSPG